MRAEIQRLREEQARIATNARAKFEEITDDTPEDRAAEIEREFDAMMADYDKLGEKIERMERLAEAEERANQGDPRRPKGENGEARGGDDGEEPTYGEVYARAIRFGADQLSQREREILLEGRAEMTLEERAQATGTDAAGGYTVPTEFSDEIDRAMAAWGPMWDGAIVRVMDTANGREIEWPTVDDTTNTGRIQTENTAVDDDGTDDVQFGQKLLNAYLYNTGMVRVPLQLLQDGAFNMEALLDDLFGERLGRLANSVLTTGTGTNQPNGIVTASALGTTAASATAIVADELVDMMHKVDPAYRASPKCRWQFNDQTLGALRKLKDGQGNFLWQMGDVRSGEPNLLLGKPYSVNQAMADIATGNRPIIFGDHSKYVVRKVMGFQTMTLRERYAENFQIGMLGFKRFDGELLNTAAVKHLAMA
jgi:HK97 family phage major capsid protein